MHNNTFIEACKKGNLIEAREIYDKYKPNIHKNNELVFKYACNYGYLDVTKWLYSLEDKPDIHIDNERPFILACLNGKIEIVKWLCLLEDKPNIHANNDKAFRLACSNGHIEIAKWLMTLEDKPNIHANNDKAFSNTCKYGYLEFAQWLYNLEDKSDIHANNDEAFRNACYNRRINIVEWLSTICDDYYIEIENNIIKNWKIKNNLQDLYDNKEYDKIIDKLKIEKNSDILVDICSICYEENSNFITSCKHYFCIECFMMWYIVHNKKQCSYCIQNIEIKKCAVKI